MTPYQSLAPFYDRLFDGDVHQKWFDFARTFFDTLPFPVDQVLDLACGTGTLSVLLAQAGCDVVGVDVSIDMLAQAAEKAQDCGDPKPLFLCQSMPRLDLYGTVEAAFCSLDSLNYLRNESEIRRTLERVSLFLRPGGLFLFDIVTPFWFRYLSEHVSTSQTDELFCVWTSEAADDFLSIRHDITLFVQLDENWRRLDETHRQITFPIARWEMLLREAGFTNVQCFGDRRRDAPTGDERRVFWAAYKPE